MIGITKLLCGATSPGDALRYGRDSSRLPHELLQFSHDKRPVVVWNFTRRCNLHCRHCYSESQDQEYPGECSTAEGKAFIDSLAEYKVPVLLFSGGEPFIRPDLFELADYAVKRGLRTVISTNGTLITPALARKAREAGISYVGISLDGLERVNDTFRGSRGAFQMTLEGLRHTREAGVKAGLRFTITRHNVKDIPDIFRLMEEEGIPRLCFYHLAYAGRGSKLVKEDLSHDETRKAVDLIFDKSLELHQRHRDSEVLTVDNHSDAPYLLLRVQREQPARVAAVHRLLKWNGGNSSGVGIGDVDNLGNVHADQFWQHYSFGNIRERKFSDIWEDTSDPLMRGLKKKKLMVKGRCAACAFLEICGGNLRVRAEAVTGDVWAPDPACYLTDEEIGLK
ncbi:MAG: radical SAM protein [Chloroflexi bacterium]|nr:radical SAM protein [Chloroflexota bacterium]